ncbi:hypothetical protein AG1IA_05209 [Rhizoctonia solani AG-1 IA]|uniref:Glutathione S-transferase n=1 Tax=Thanatephorus cucumeris (strain AG1-IA) TaxID=983506 RepID=L8WRP1_THACA|nr:hypothetical protein AG1IA_05209 [Rhizoctonia solani AG-1 IA]
MVRQHNRVCRVPLKRLHYAGHKTSIFLEELKDAYGFQYDVQKIDFQVGDNPMNYAFILLLIDRAFVEKRTKGAMVPEGATIAHSNSTPPSNHVPSQINPNGRIPALVDRSRGNFAVFESAAILLYLAQVYCLIVRLGLYSLIKFIGFHSTTTRNASSAMILSQIPTYTPKNCNGSSSLTVVSVQCRVKPTTSTATRPRRSDLAQKLVINFVMDTLGYINETKRLYSVLNDRLTDREYLVGPGKGRYGLADINAYPWVRSWSWAGVDSLEAFPNVEAWLKRISERPQVDSGLDVPEPRSRKALTKEEEEEAAEGARKWILQAQK